MIRVALRHDQVAPQLRELAHTYYMERVHELYSDMQLCQDQFRQVLRVASPAALR